jgi:hypothetical protein
MSADFPSSQPHEMRLETTHPSGAEEWHCPECGRRFVVNWPPAYKKIVLVVGDEHVAHSGGKGGLKMGVPQLHHEEEELLLSDELRSALEDALKDIDFDDWDNPPVVP